MEGHTIIPALLRLCCMKRNFLKLQNWMLATLMGALGFTSCHSHRQLAVDTVVDTTSIPTPPPQPEKPIQKTEPRDEIRVMYGVPTMNYTIRGQVKDPKGRPVKDLKVNLLERGMETEADSVVGDPERVNHWLDGTNVLTDENGRFEITNSGLPLDEVKLLVRDTDGKKNGSLKNQVVTVQVTPEMVDRSNAYGMNVGDLNMDLSIKMKNK